MFIRHGCMQQRLKMVGYVSTKFRRLHKPKVSRLLGRGRLARALERCIRLYMGLLLGAIGGLARLLIDLCVGEDAVRRYYLGPIVRTYWHRLN